MPDWGNARSGLFKFYSMYFFTLSSLALSVSQGKEWPPLVVDPTDSKREAGVTFPQKCSYTMVGWGARRHWEVTSPSSAQGLNRGRAPACLKFLVYKWC